MSASVTIVYSAPWPTWTSSADGNSMWIWPGFCDGWSSVLLGGDPISFPYSWWRLCWGCFGNPFGYIVSRLRNLRIGAPLKCTMLPMRLRMCLV